MITTRVIFPEWRDENLLTKFPFEDGATLTSTEGLQLPKSLFVDGIFYIVGVTSELYLSSLIKDESTRLITVYLSTPNKTNIASGELEFDNIGEELCFYDVYGRPAGVLVSNPLNTEDTGLDFLRALEEGTYTFTLAATRFSSTVLVPMPQVGVSALSIPSGEIFTGDVWIIGERGVVLREDDGKLRVDVVGEVLSRQRECIELNERGEELVSITGNTFTGLELEVNPYIKTINNEVADEYGNFFIKTPQIRGVLRVTPGTNQLVFTLAR